MFAAPRRLRRAKRTGLTPPAAETPVNGREDSLRHVSTLFRVFPVVRHVRRAVHGPFRAAVIGPTFMSGSRGDEMRCQARSRASCFGDEEDAGEPA